MSRGEYVYLTAFGGLWGHAAFEREHGASSRAERRKYHSEAGVRPNSTRRVQFPVPGGGQMAVVTRAYCGPGSGVPPGARCPPIASK